MAESVQALYFTLNATLSPSTELKTQLQATTTLLRLLDVVPDSVNLDPEVIDLIKGVISYCVAVKKSVERFSQSDSQDWTTFRHEQRDFTAIAKKLQVEIATITIGGLHKLYSAGHIRFSPQGLQEYQDLIADATAASMARLQKVDRSLTALEEGLEERSKLAKESDD
ncbi:hypothetical protein K469DRAFT_745158 [Zopfia rhizophila CBS 207.26]|uniref:Fungal N-terminal domain-containing protein n=1 Tax=Zopfia rhizophila CBS 207.26 TaxID=1314779 RepID=A0A6A6ES91_9PEZI|nr:hypothetical protein K469DRAFT_745158 [Zopfia rhizophila CBS 207.26]